MAEEKKFLGTAAVERLIANTRTEIEAAKTAANSYADSLADNYDAAGTAQTKVNELATGAVKTNTDHIGTLANLETTAKGDLVTAINEVRNAVSAGGTAAAMTMEEKTAGLGEGIAKAYVLKQGENTVGTINIPKDMVVQSGEVVTNPEGQAEGTYIKLTLANATNDIIYVNVGTLVDIYKAKASATQVQLVIDSATREISATIVAGSIGANELAANSVVTAKIADGNVTKAKLASDVQASLDKADAAAQDATDKANQALEDAKAHATEILNDYDTSVVNPLDDKITGLGTRVANLELIDHDHSNATQLATYDKTQSELLAAAKSEAEGMLNELYTTVSGDLTVFDERIDALEAIDHEHANATQLATYDKTQAELLAAAGRAATEYTDELAEAVQNDNTAMDNRVKALEAIDHEHTNATQLATYDKTQTELLDAAKTNAADTGAVVLSEAQSYADGLNTAMNARVEALESVSYVEITASEIDAMFDAE